MDKLSDNVRSVLKDPDSAKFKWAKLILPLGKANTDGSSLSLDYCFQVNAKNGFGGYTGFQDVYAVVSDTNVYVLYIDNLHDHNAQSFCEGKGYYDFPF